MLKKLPKAALDEITKISTQMQALDTARYNLILGTGLGLGITEPVADWEVDLEKGTISLKTGATAPSPVSAPSPFDAVLEELELAPPDELEADLLARDKKAGKGR